MKFFPSFFTIFWLLISPVRITADEVCTVGYTDYGDYCYRVPNDAETYWNALAFCKSEGAQLVSIHDPPTNDFIRGLAKDELLVGLIYNEGIKNYSWSDGSKLDYTNYVDGFVAFRDYFGYCAKIGSSGKWANAECEYDEYQFLCQKKAINESASEYRTCPDPSKLYVDAGEIASPGYPAAYDASSVMECSYKLAVKNNYFISIKVEEANLGDDYINVYKTFNTDKANLVSTITSSSLNVSTIVNTNMVLLVFSGKGHGTWKLKFDTTITEQTCVNSRNYINVDDWCIIYCGDYTYSSFGEPNYECLFHHRAEVLSIHSQAEQDALSNMLNVSSESKFQLIGLKCYGANQFIWYDGTPLTYTNFGSGFVPTTADNYLTFNRDRAWINGRPDFFSEVFCKKPATRILVTPTSRPDPYTIYENAGEIFSLGYPQPYKGSCSPLCRYRLRAKQGYRIYMYFVPVGTSGEHQLVTFYSGWEENDDHLLGKATAKHKLLISQAGSNTMLVVYDAADSSWWQGSWYSTKDSDYVPVLTSDSETADRSDKLDAWNVPSLSISACPYQEISKGYTHIAITSPGFPSSYTANQDCIYYSNSTQHLSEGQYWRVDFIRLRIGHDDYIKLIDLRTNTIFAMTDTNIREDLALAVPFDFAVEFHSGSLQSTNELWRIVTYPNEPA